MAVNITSCSIGCGTRIAYTLTDRDLDSFLLKFAKQDRRYNVCIFSDREEFGHGAWYATQLAKHGKVIESDSFINPVHNSKCRVWIWHPNEAGWTYMEELKAKAPKDTSFSYKAGMLYGAAPMEAAWFPADRAAMYQAGYAADRIPQYDPIIPRGILARGSEAPIGAAFNGLRTDQGPAYFRNGFWYGYRLCLDGVGRWLFL